MHGLLVAFLTGEELANTRFPPETKLKPQHIIWHKFGQYKNTQILNCSAWE